MSHRFDLFVIGAGVAGLTAAEEAAGRGLTVAITEEAMFGGLIMNVNHLQPGIEGQSDGGADLASDLMTRVSGLGVTTLFDAVTGLSGVGDAITVATASGVHLARTVVVASGARLRKLGAPGEDGFEHRGVSHCADCDGPMFRGKPVMVVGGGDSALQEALVLAQFCSVVHLVHRGEAFSARQSFIDAVGGEPRIAVRFRTVVEALKGGGALSSVLLRDLASGQSHEAPCEGFFAQIGLEPNTAFLPASVEREDGCVRVDDKLESSMANVFAIGAARLGYRGQLKDAVADAKQAVSSISDRLRTA